MTKNQKIALGCGGAGCLGIVFLIVVAAGLYIFNMGRLKTLATNRNSTVTSNYNSNSNEDNSDSDSANRNSNRATSDASSSLSEDGKHKLFQAASMSGDPDLLHRASVKIGIINEDDTPTSKNAAFLREHVSWGAKSYDFIGSISTPEKARAYAEAHIDD